MINQPSEEKYNILNHSPMFSKNNWEMKTAPTSRIKFLLSINPFRFHQLDFVKKHGKKIVVKTLSGKVCFFTEGEFTVRKMTKDTLRGFAFKSTGIRKEKITFWEARFQMETEWWDELEDKISQLEKGKTSTLSKILHILGDIAEED